MLSLKGLHILSHEKSEHAYQKAYKLFEKAIKNAPENEEAIYYLGLMNLLGLGRDQDIELALDYFNRPELKINQRALNAKGYIYFHAPELMEQDQVKLKVFGSIRQDLKAAYTNFK
jgi:TPR repeat protein